MICPQCNEEINSNSVKQGSEFYCSLECANLAAGYTVDEEDGYYEEDDLSRELFSDYEEE